MKKNLITTCNTCCYLNKSEVLMTFPQKYKCSVNDDKYITQYERYYYKCEKFKKENTNEYKS